MNTYVTGKTIKQLRQEKGFTQEQLAELLGVSGKTVSKWETAKGLPDISLLKELAAVLGISVCELMSGDTVTNTNRSANLLRSCFYVCPLCGNVIHAMGEGVVHCCGILLPPLEAEEPDDLHGVTLEQVEDETFVTVNHPMTKEHYISFIAYVTTDRMQLVKLYPEGNAQTRLQLRGLGYLYFYCNRHGLKKIKPISPRKRK